MIKTNLQILIICLCAVATSWAQDGQFGKIWYQSLGGKNRIYVNKVNQGVLVIDNKNAKSPKVLGSITVNGNGDLAMKGDILFADSFDDLVAIDISNEAAPKELSRIRGVFPHRRNRNNNNQSNAITWMRYQNSQAGMNASSGFGSSMGGSMSRFALHGDYLYAIDNRSIQVVDVSDPSNIRRVNTVGVGDNIETILAKDNNLYIGSQRAMYILNTDNPQAPRRSGQFQHASGCDPVAVEGKYAYVTIRDGRSCNSQNINQLQVIDISNPSRCRRVAAMNLNSPRGLTVEDGHVFVADGSEGVRKLHFDGDKVRTEGQNNSLNGAYDLILTPQGLIGVSPTQLLQFDRNLKRLSRLSNKSL